MSIKFYDLDKKVDYDRYNKEKEESEMKKKNYSAMYKFLADEKPAEKVEDTLVEEETKSEETIEEKKDEIYPGNIKVSPNTKGEVVHIDNLRVRKAPSTDAEIIQTISKKMIVDVLSKTNAKEPWYEIKKTFQNGSVLHGHVMGQYLDVYVDG